MKKKLVDTNIFLRLLLKDNIKLFTKAQKAVAAQTEDSCVLTMGVAMEILFIMKSKGYSRKKVVTAVTELMQWEQFSYDEVNLAPSLDLYATSGLDFVDCYLITRALGSSEEPLSLDQNLQKTYDNLKNLANF